MSRAVCEAVAMHVEDGSVIEDVVVGRPPSPRRLSKPSTIPLTIGSRAWMASIVESTVAPTPALTVSVAAFTKLSRSDRIVATVVGTVESPLARHATKAVALAKLLVSVTQIWRFEATPNGQTTESSRAVCRAPNVESVVIEPVRLDRGSDPMRLLAPFCVKARRAATSLVC